MQLPRREFLKTSLAATAATALATRASAATTVSAGAGRDYYELRAYKLPAGATLDALDAYFEKGALPALEKRRVKNVGVFTELVVDKRAGTSAPKPDTPVWVVIPHTSLESYVDVAATLNTDPAVQKAGAGWLDVPKGSPSFTRIDTWLYLAFKSMPRMDVPAFAQQRAPGRVFEMRDYQSHSELKALNKMAMFDAGEAQLMRDLGMSPVFFGQGIAGPDLPHLRYFTGGADLAAHLAAWAKFGPDPRWKTLSADPQYKDNTSLNTARFLAPRAYSWL